MERSKIYSASQQTGDEVEKPIARLLARAGHTWHNRKSDHGIDGEIELVDPTARRPLNVHLLVQSKATAGRFPSETDSTCRYNVTTADVRYRKEASVPVLLICSRPRAGDARWAPTTRGIPTSGSSWRVGPNKSSDRLDESAGAALLAFVTASTRTKTLVAPIRRLMRLQTNLLSVAALYEGICVAPTSKRSARELGPALRELGFFRSDWIVREWTVFRFARPTPDGLGAFTDGGGETLDVDEWANSKDPETLRRIADLLRQTLSNHEHRILRFHGKERYFYLRGTSYLEPRLIKLGRGSGRSVFKPYFMDSGELRELATSRGRRTCRVAKLRDRHEPERRRSRRDQT